MLEAVLAVRTVMDGGAVDAVARAIVHHLHRLVPCAAVALFLGDGDESFPLAAVAGPHGAAARRRWESDPPRSGRQLSPAHFAALSGAPGLAVVPLRARRKAIGAFVLAAPADVTVGERAQARAFAGRLAAPLEHFLLIGELQAAALAAEQPADLSETLRVILAGVRRVVPADAAGILVRDEAHARIIAVDGHPAEVVGLTILIAGNVSLHAPLLRGEPERLADLGSTDPAKAVPGAQRIRGHLAAPMVAGGEIVGVLAIDSWRRDAFDDEDLKRACRFAAHAAAALARARAHAQAQAEVVALREAATLATRDPSTGARDILPSILDGVRRVIACDGASVLLREGAHARIAAVHGHSPAVLDHRFTIDEQPTLQRVLVDGLPVVSPDLSAEQGYVPLAAGRTVRGYLAVPLIANGAILGMLAVDSLRRGAFGPEDVGRVELFAGYVAAALLNARLHDAVRRAAERDPVTDLYNHRAIHDHLDRALARARETDTPLAVLMIDVDGFKLYNDTHGHIAGDVALQAVAGALRTACRTADIVGRYGGDEFLVVASGLTPGDAGGLARRLRDAVAARTLCLGNQVVPLRISVGVAAYPTDGIDRDVLVACADARLYDDKTGSEIVVPAGSGPGGGADGGGDLRGLPGLDASPLMVLNGLVTAVDRKDRYTRAHSEQVTRLALLLARALGLSPDTVRTVRLAGLLHDVGKIGVPDRILKKPGPLTPDEVEIMNAHPTLGEAIVAGLPDLAAIRTGVRSHHERWDGRGYPDRLAGERIPFLGRLLAVPDCYSAMTSDRPYRAALSPAQALREIARGAGAQFDPAIADAFLRVMRQEGADTPWADGRRAAILCADDTGGVTGASPTQADDSGGATGASPTQGNSASC